MKGLHHYLLENSCCCSYHALERGWQQLDVSSSGASPPQDTGFVGSGVVGLQVVLQLPAEHARAALQLRLSGCWQQVGLATSMGCESFRTLDAPPLYTACILLSSNLSKSVLGM